jgi:hypothetical protein
MNNFKIGTPKTPTLSPTRFTMHPLLSITTYTTYTNNPHNVFSPLQSTTSRKHTTLLPHPLLLHHLTKAIKRYGSRHSRGRIKDGTALFLVGRLCLRTMWMNTILIGIRNLHIKSHIDDININKNI